LATGLLDRGKRVLGGTGDLEGRSRLQLPIGEQAVAVLDAADDAGGLEGLGGRRPGSGELAGIDRGLNAAQRDCVEGLCEDVGEATLRQAAMQRHLTAFEALDCNARAGLLTLDTTATGLALARTNATADAHALLGGTRIVPEFVEFHR